MLRKNVLLVVLSRFRYPAPGDAVRLRRLEEDVPDHWKFLFVVVHEKFRAGTVRRAQGGYHLFKHPAHAETNVRRVFTDREGTESVHAERVRG